MLHVILLATALCGSVDHFSAAVKGSLEATLVRKSGPDGRALAAQAARLLRWRGDIIRNIHPNDRIHLVYAKHEEPELMALHYDGADISLQAYRYIDTDGVPRFYDETGSLIEPWMQSLPVPGYVQITETVQRGRGKRKHNGIDLKAPEGTPISLPFDARVNRVNWSQRINGRCVEVVYADGKLARFLHLEEVGADVKPGQRLRAGTLLGTVGNTGRSSAPHLHYEILTKSGQPLDPLRHHGTERKILSDLARIEFQAVRQRLEALLHNQSNGRPI